jgi:Uma2 family endonuclease
MYAAADVREYWIVNCEERQVEVYTDPHAGAKRPHYRQLTTYLPGQSFSVRIAGKKLGDLAVNDLFPPKK